MTTKQISVGRISTSEKEILDLLKAWIAISIAFAIAMQGPSFSADFYVRFIIASLTVGTGFLLHEMGHKIVAQRYGCFAEFRSFDNMLVLAVIMSFFGFIFAAPGAVMISGRITKKKNGIISAAGPIVNLFLALIFLILLFLDIPNFLKTIAHHGFIINSWLALFNMLPFWLFDGYKIFKWNKIVYGAIGCTAIGFMLLISFIPKMV